MSRKDFELIARQIRESGESFASNTAHASFAEGFARKLADANPRFDGARFVMASMPAWMVGTSKANVWERVARKF